MDEYVNTNWTGRPEYATPPLSSTAYQRQNLFSGYQPPRVQPQFNFGSSMPAQIAGMAATMLAPQMLGIPPEQMKLYQFNPTQNLVDRQYAHERSAQGSRAIQAAQIHDGRQMAEFAKGASRLFHQRELTREESAQLDEGGQMLSKHIPMAMAALGADTVDKMLGGRSASVFAAHMADSWHSRLDGVTGRVGTTGDSTSMISNTLFEEYYGAKGDASKVHNLTAGQTGQMLKMMEARGMLGQSAGSMSFAEQRRALPSSLDDKTMDQIVDRLPEIKELRDANKPVSQSLLDTKRKEVEQTLRDLKDPTKDIKASQLGGDDNKTGMAGGQDIVRTLDAARIKARAEDMSKSVRIMADIFGDSGRADAPMSELFNALEAFTQNQGGEISATKTQDLLLEVQSVAKSTGVGIDNLQAASSAAAQRAAAMGLAPIIGVQAALSGTRAAAAAADSGAFDPNNPLWGRADKEKLARQETDDRLRAAGSLQASQLNAAAYLADNGFAPTVGSEAEAYVKAIKNKQNTYTFDGKTYDLNKTQTAFTDMLSKGMDIDSATIFQTQNNTDLIAEKGFEYDTASLVKRNQVPELIRQRLAVAVGVSGFGSQLEPAGVDKLLEAAGLAQPGGGKNTLRALEKQAAASMSKKVIGMDPADYAKLSKDVDAQAALARGEMKNALMASNPNMTDAEAELQMSAMDKAMGPNGWKQIGSTSLTVMDSVTKENTGKHLSNLNQSNNDRALAAEDKRRMDDELDVAKRGALAGIGMTSPMARAMDAIKDAAPGDNLNEVLAKVLGVEDYKKYFGDEANKDTHIYKWKELAMQERELTGNSPEVDKKRNNIRLQMREHATAIKEGKDVDQIRLIKDLEPVDPNAVPAAAPVSDPSKKTADAKEATESTASAKPATKSNPWDVVTNLFGMSGVGEKLATTSDTKGTANDPIRLAGTLTLKKDGTVDLAAVADKVAANELAAGGLK